TAVRSFLQRCSMPAPAVTKARAAPLCLECATRWTACARGEFPIRSSTVLSMSAAGTRPAPGADRWPPISVVYGNPSDRTLAVWPRLLPIRQVPGRATNDRGERQAGAHLLSTLGRAKALGYGPFA